MTNEQNGELRTIIREELGRALENVLEPINESIKALNYDIASVKRDITEMKSDIKSLKASHIDLAKSRSNTESIIGEMYRYYQDVRNEAIQNKEAD